MSTKMSKIRKLGIPGSAIGIIGAFVMAVVLLTGARGQYYDPDFNMWSPFYHIAPLVAGKVLLTAAAFLIAVALFASVQSYQHPVSRIVTGLAACVFLVSGALALLWLVPHADDFFAVAGAFRISYFEMREFRQLWTWGAVSALAGLTLVGLVGEIEKIQDTTRKNSYRLTLLGGGLALLVALIGMDLRLSLLTHPMDLIILGTVLSSLAYLGMFFVFYKPLRLRILAREGEVAKTSEK